MTADIIPLKANSDRVDFSLQHKVECYQKVWREWGSHLDPYEQAIVLQLIDRTVGWGRREVYCTARALLHGDRMYAGMKMGRTKFYEALASLEKSGTVRRRKDTNVPDRVHFTVNMNWSPDALNLPKRLQKGADPVRVANTPVRLADYPVREPDTIESNHKPVSFSQYHSSPVPGSRRSNPAEKIRGIVNQSAAANAEARRAPGATRIERNTAEGVEASWRTALAEAFPQAAEPAWTGREKGQAKRAASGWTNKRQIAFIDFVEWAVINWTAIMRKQFKWMKKSPPPATPAFRFFIAMLDQFADCWSEDTLEAWLSDKDRTELERLMGRGMTYGQATAELGKKHAARALHSEMEKREINVRARERSAEFKEKRAERLAAFGNAPVHPRSRAAQRMIAEARKPAAQPADEEFAPLAAPMIDANKNPFDYD